MCKCPKGRECPAWCLRAVGGPRSRVGSGCRLAVPPQVRKLCLALACSIWHSSWQTGKLWRPQVLSEERHLLPDDLQLETEPAAPEQATVGAGKGTIRRPTEQKKTSPVGNEHNAPYRTVSPSWVWLYVKGKGNQRELLSNCVETSSILRGWVS